MNNQKSLLVVLITLVIIAGGYFLYYNNYKSKEKTWHITYYPSYDLYLVDYGFE